MGFARAFGFRRWQRGGRHLLKAPRPQALREFFSDFDVTELALPDTKMAEAKGEAIARCARCSCPSDRTCLYEHAATRHRASHGIYYTASLVGRLIDQATTAGVGWTCARVLIPRAAAALS